MGSDSIPLWIAFIVCVLGGAYFAATESSFSAANKIKIKAAADEGNVLQLAVFDFKIDLAGAGSAVLMVVLHCVIPFRYLVRSVISAPSRSARASGGRII